jgi:hypothetical protein
MSKPAHVAPPSAPVATKQRNAVESVAVAQNGAQRATGVGSDLERTFDTWIKRLAPELPPATPEYRFAPPRRWRFDRAWVVERVAIELEGGVWSGGRHTRPAGYEADAEKYNAATCEGWRVLRFTAKMLKDDPAACIGMVVEVLEGKTE